MQQYLDLLNHVLTHGEKRSNRTDIDTIGVFGYQFRHDLRTGFPAITTKKLFFKGVVHELLWIISGSTNIKYLQDNNIAIWNEWADSNGNLGPVYGKQLRNFADKVDQLQSVINSIKQDPYSRRHVISLWNPCDLDKQALACCHGTVIQFHVNNKNQLSCQMYQRSADAFLGVPFNIASYALLTHMIAQICDLYVGDYVHTFGDLHIYENHIEQVKEQINRKPYDLCSLWLNEKVDCIDKFVYNDIGLIDYKSHALIKGTVAV